MINLTGKLIDLLLSSEAMDCCFKVGKVEIKAHRKILSAFSSVFATMFSGNWATNVDPITITDAPIEHFRAFLDFFYKGQIKLSAENVMSILYLAHKYDVQELVSTCLTFASGQVCAKNVIEYYCSAVRFNQNDLKVKCTEFMSAHTEEVLKSNEFMQCDADTLKCILQLAELSCKEVIVFNSCIAWATNKCRSKGLNVSYAKNLRDQLADCFSLIRFKAMESNEFATCIESYEAMFTNEESKAIFMHFMRMKGCASDVRDITMKRTVAVFNEINLNFNPIETAYSKETEIRFFMSQAIMLSGISFSQPRQTSPRNEESSWSDAYIQIRECGLDELLGMSVKTTQQKYSRVTFPKLLHIPQNRVISIKIETKNNSTLTYTDHQICEQNSIGFFPSASTPLSYISALHFQRIAK